MSDKRKFNEIDEQELEQITGGSGKKLSKVYHCPVCQREETVWYYEGDIPGMPKLCYMCQLEGRGDVKMK